MPLHPEGAPKKGIEIRVSEARDADCHASNLTNWQQTYDQTSRGNFYGSIVELPLEGLQVFRENTSQALQQKCVVWPDSVWLGVPLAGQDEGRINGLTIRPGTVMCRPGDCEFELTTPRNYNLYGMVVSREALTKMARIHGTNLIWNELEEYGRLGVPGTTLEQLRFLLARLLSGEHSVTPSHLQYDILMMALLEVLSLETPQPAKTQSYHHRKQVVDRARQFIENHLDEPITMTQLCDVANVSRRTLQYSFESIIGISPIHYLRVCRLNGTRRALIQSQNEEGVADIAAQWGFWHLSQFAKDYRQLFGELPSKTLERRF